MSTINSLKLTQNLIKENPKIILIVFLQFIFFFLFFFIEKGGQILLPFINFITLPFFIGGLYGIILKAKKGNLLSNFIFYGRFFYIKLLLSLIIVSFLFSFSISATSIFIFLKAQITIPQKTVLLVQILSILTFALGLSIHFFDVSMVIENCGIMESFEKSFAFVKRRILPFFTYLVILYILSFFPNPYFLALGFPAAVLYHTLQIFPLTFNLNFEIINLIVGVIFTSIYYAFHLLFYSSEQHSIS